VRSDRCWWPATPFTREGSLPGAGRPDGGAAGDRRTDVPRRATKARDTSKGQRGGQAVRPKRFKTANARGPPLPIFLRSGPRLRFLTSAACLHPSASSSMSRPCSYLGKLHWRPPKSGISKVGLLVTSCRLASNSCFTFDNYWRRTCIIPMA